MPETPEGARYQLFRHATSFFDKQLFPHIICVTYFIRTVKSFTQIMIYNFDQSKSIAGFTTLIQSFVVLRKRNNLAAKLTRLTQQITYNLPLIKEVLYDNL